ncbi:MAG: ABC transporter ATP-binding protein [Myxococcales bacterium]|nr:ABC transporter ATP-binding protein [Myxococcales bacterium]
MRAAARRAEPAAAPLRRDAAAGESLKRSLDPHGEETLGKAYDARLIRRLWQFIQPYRGIFWLSIACLPLNAACMLAQPFILKLAIDRYVTTGDTAGLGRTALVYAVAIVGECGFFYVQYYLTMLVAQRSLADLRVQVFAHVQSLPMSYFDRNPIGRLVTRLTSDVDVLNEMFAAGAMTIFMDVLTMLGIVVIMVSLDARLAAAALALMPVLVLGLDFFRHAARRTYRQIRERIARLNAYLQEALSGMTIIQLFAREARCFGEFDALNDDYRQANHWSNIYEAALFSLVEALASMSGAVMVWYAAGDILAGAIAFGTLVAFLEYIQRFFIPIREFSTKYAVMQSAMASAERVFQLLDTVPTIVSPVSGHAPAASRGAIEFDHVWFAYKDEEFVLRDVTFAVPAGEKVAIVGATGSGKTTLIKLLSRFYDVSRGAIRVDGVDVREWDLRALRRRIGTVLQDVFLFSGDVASNISLGRPDITDAAIEDVARRVNAWPFIRALPGKLHERLRERGSNLSTGQRQLLAFARALAYDPAILVLDEATSSVDTETEMLIQEALATLMRDRTALVIAHRLSTIEHADRIVVLHHGVVREIGTHRELIAARGIYNRLYELQYALADAEAEPVVERGP